MRISEDQANNIGPLHVSDVPEQVVAGNENSSEAEGLAEAVGAVVIVIAPDPTNNSTLSVGSADLRS